MWDPQKQTHKHYDAILQFAPSGQVCDQDKGDLGRHSPTREQMTQQHKCEVIHLTDDSDFFTMQQPVYFQ